MDNAPSNTFRPTGSVKGLSSFGLKLIAVLLMTIDHISAVLSFNGVYNQGPAILGIPVWRVIGRIAFPIFAFMIAEGAMKTRSVPRYLLRLGVFALLSEIPFDLACKTARDTYGVIEFSAHQNVYFTLALGLLSVWCLKLLRGKNLGWLSVFPAAACGAAAYYLQTDYSWAGVICIYLMAVSANLDPVPCFIGNVCAIFLLCFSFFNFNTVELFALVALVPIFFYNGEKGRKINKYVFYAFYPVHLLLIWAIVTAVLS